MKLWRVLFIVVTFLGRLFAAVFHAKEGYLRSRISPFGFQAMSANVYKDLSQLDQRECIVMDFTRSLPVSRGIRDELRLIAPALYLGRTMVGRRRTIQFAISFQHRP